MGLNFKELRLQMVQNQLIKRGITDKAVINAFKNVKREKFMLEKNKKLAYEDGAQKIEAGQTISQPYIVAYMLQALELTKEDKVLEIGTGSGYAAALLAEIVSRVYTVEKIEKLADKAASLLKELNYCNLKVEIKDGSLGLEKYAPYNAILVSAAAPDVPPKLIEQLAAKGKLIIPIGRANEIQQLKLFIKKPNGKIKEKELEYVRFVPLIGRESWR